MPNADLTPVDDVVDQLMSRAACEQAIERVSISDCYGRVLAKAVQSSVDVPPADNSSMDGYAVNTADSALSAGATLPVSDRIAAGYVGRPLAAGTVARIFTGAPVPEGANAIVIQENTEANGDRVRIDKVPDAGENIRPAGQDVRKGSVVMPAGKRIRPQDAALLASVGTGAVDVYRRLRVAIMSTGDELVQPPGPAGPGQIFNSNHYALIGLIGDLGMEVVDLGLVKDTAAATEEALQRGAGAADCILSSGGVSVGDEDHVKAVIERLGELTIWRIAIKPGKPLAFGRVGNTPFFGLPGNPVSTFVTFLMIARPYLLKCQGVSEPLQRHLTAAADFSMAGGTRREYIRVRVEAGDDGVVRASRFENQGSGIMSSVSWANALAVVDIGQSVAPGDLLKIYLLEE